MPPVREGDVTPNFDTQLRQVFKRLEAANTKIKRRNARRALAALLRAIEKHAKHEFPYLDKYNKPIPIRKQPTCPMCGIPAKDWTAIAVHCGKKHGRVKERNVAGWETYTCWCGEVFLLPGKQQAKRFGRHLARIKDFRLHFVEATLEGIG
jgi:hypothetical protein